MTILSRDTAPNTTNRPSTGIGRPHFLGRDGSGLPPTPPKLRGDSPSWRRWFRKALILGVDWDAVVQAFYPPEVAERQRGGVGIHSASR